MHIAVCIQERKNRDLLSNIFDMYQEQNGCILFICFFKNSIDLLCDLVGGDYDVIFFNEFEDERLSQEIREKDRKVRLIQLIGLNCTTQNDPDIWYYLPQPPSSTFLFPILDRLRPDTMRENVPWLLVQSKGSIMQLPFSHMEYVEVIGRAVFFHLTDGTTEEAVGAFSEFEPRLLSWPDFIKVHRAYIINLRHIQKLESGSVLTSSGHSVPISRTLYPQFKKDYLCHLMDPKTKTADLTVSATAPVLSSSDTCSILLVDDEEEQRLHWSEVLTAHGCTLHTAYSGETALALAGMNHFDCVVLDVKLGNECGFDLCSALAEQTGAPVVFLSSLDDFESQTQGFLSGGIDYITKDATDALFWLKIETRIKMARAARAEYNDGSLRLNLKERRTYLKGQEVTLTTIEFDILSLLIRNPGVVYTPMRIYEAIWGITQPDSGQTVQLHISLLARKLSAVCPHHRFIETVWGKGYRFVSMTTREEKLNETM